MRLLKFFRNQKGYSLLEITLGGMIASVALLSTVYYQVQAVQDKKAKALAAQLQMISGGVEKYRTENNAQLISAVPVVPGFANAMQPTTAELRAAGYLDAGISDTNIYGSGYVVFITQEPGGCIPPNCEARSTTSISAPILKNDGATVDTSRLGLCASEIGGDAGISYDTATFEGAGGGWSYPNPLATAGLVAVQGGFGSTSDNHLYWRDGSHPVTADFQGGGFNVDNVADVNASGTVSGATGSFTGNVTAGGTLSGAAASISGTSTAARHTSTTDSRAPIFYDSNNTAFRGDFAGTSVMNRIDASIMYDRDNTSYYSDPASTSRLNYANINEAQLNTVRTEGTACSPNGRIARNSVGLLLSCQSGVWKSLGGGGLSGYEIRSKAFSHGAGFQGPFTVTCSSGKKVVGGGCRDVTSGLRYIRYTYPAGTTGWSCAGQDEAIYSSGTMYVYAICVTP